MSNIKRKYYVIPIALCLIAAIAVITFYFSGSFSLSDRTEYVNIDSDDDLDSVTTKLSPIASSRSMAAFRILARHSGYHKNIRTGHYAIEPTKSAVSILRLLKNGHQTPIQLTIPESRTMEKLSVALSRRLMLDSITTATLLCDSTYLAQWGYDTATIASLFIPNTYEVYWNTSLDQLLKRMKREHDSFWNTSRRAKAEALGLSPLEVCTLASIIDEETANNAEKPMVAGMYLNRLKIRMPLQADPTIKFALRDFALRRIYHNMLLIDSPWNTYRYAGLPPGPIKIASVAAIDAVLNPVDHQYIYMCAKEDFSGTHNFARTYQEHLKNAARYTQALNQRGIK